MKTVVFLTALALASIHTITCQNIKDATQMYQFNIALMPEMLTTEAMTTTTESTTTTTAATTSTTTESPTTATASTTTTTPTTTTTTTTPSTTTTTTPSTTTITSTTTTPPSTTTAPESTADPTTEMDGTPALDEDYIANDETVTEDNTTSIEPPTTQTPEYLAPIEDLQIWLYGQYDWTTGYMALVVKSSAVPVVMQQSNSQAYLYTYDVTYNVSVLSAEGALGNKLIEQFNMVKTNITNSNEQFPGNFTIDQEETNTVMTQNIQTATESIQSSCDSLGAICNNINTTCYLENDQITCADKCMLYSIVYDQCESPPNPPGVYNTGECNLIDGNAFCNCGMSTGNVLDNFWDGQKCVSATFIVCICACLGGGLIVIFMSIVIWLATERRRQKEIPDSDTLPINGYGKSEYPTQAYTNSAYDVDPEIRNSDAYKGFTPNLQSVDTSTSYQIKRPSVRRGDSPPRDYARVSSEL